MADLGNIGAGISIGSGDAATGGGSLIGAALRVNLLGFGEVLATDAGIAAGVQPEYADPTAITMELVPQPAITVTMG